MTERRCRWTFLASDPGAAVQEAVRGIATGPEEITIDGREMVCHFPDGMGKTKLPFAKIERMLGCPVTTRNWEQRREIVGDGGSARGVAWVRSPVARGSVRFVSRWAWVRSWVGFSWELVGLNNLVGSFGTNSKSGT